MQTALPHKSIKSLQVCEFKKARAKALAFSMEKKLCMVKEGFSIIRVRETRQGEGRLLFSGTLPLSSAHSGTKLEALRLLRASTDGLTLPSKRSAPPLCRNI